MGHSSVTNPPGVIMNNGINPPMGNIESAKQNLVKDLAAVAADGSAIINDEMAQARTRLDASLSHAKTRLIDTGTAVSEQAAHAAEATASYVRQNPWKTLGIAAATGVIVGAMLKRW
ncbi:MAG: hypothetical protein CVU34_16780 [Betaproteobacteria bacterium HGW-Betaproteobacteria-7]|jgi:ElaB/YqjD/DUF883 family membrane-anchored ribosome-binding protein|nr:MAG: hypothetical protein CVU34_16780 [Betaproteobacteria bacterium HGW-Betaproteobacteria-7]